MTGVHPSSSQPLQGFDMRANGGFKVHRVEGFFFVLIIV